MTTVSPPAGKRQWSITARLVVLYLGSSIVLLFASFGALYLSFRANVDDEDRRYLHEQLEVLHAQLAETPAGARVVFHRLAWDRESLITRHFSARVLDSNGNVVVETPGMSLLVPPAVFPSPAAGSTASASWRPTDGRSHLLAAMVVEIGPEGVKLLLQVALNQSADEATLAELRKRISIIVVAGILVAAGLGALVARRALRPLRAIAEAAATVRATQLRTRVAATGWPHELAGLADAFDQMLERLEESFDRLSRFSGDLSHELRTPIANLRGEAEVLLGRARTADEYRQAVESALEEYGRLSRLIDNLLLLARADSAELGLQTTPLDLHHELESIARFYETSAEDKGVALTSGGQGVVASEPVFFRRMVGNLVDNALRYTPRGGSISLTANIIPGRFVEVAVSDTGEGIAPEHLNRVFDRFYRVDSSANTAAKGFGLGLSIVKSIMKLHGGEVTIESRPGHGTRVALKFPPKAA